jgi:hypothetical protein
MGRQGNLAGAEGTLAALEREYGRVEQALRALA